MIDCDIIDMDDRFTDGETEGPWGMSIEERRELVDEILDLRLKHDDISRQILVEQDPCERLKYTIASCFWLKHPGCRALAYPS